MEMTIRRSWWKAATSGGCGGAGECASGSARMRRGCPETTRAWKCSSHGGSPTRFSTMRSVLEIVPLEPSHRLKVLEAKSGWLNWAWRFWGTTTLIANANWWYLGTSGRLPLGALSGGGGGRAGFRGAGLLLGPADMEAGEIPLAGRCGAREISQSTGLAAGTLSCVAALPPVVSRAGAFHRGKRQRAGGERGFADGLSALAHRRGRAGDLTTACR